jgi:hypothetical protein
MNKYISSKYPFNIKFLAHMIVCSVLLITGCYEIELPGQEHTIKNIVGKYNSYLIEANKTRDVSHLKEIADEHVTIKLSLWMAAWEDGNVYLDAELRNIDFNDMKITGESAVVMTRENWSYIYRDLDTQEIAEPRQYVSYSMQYQLEKKEKSWLIMEVTIIKEEQG